jgi:hypothetical protein
MSINTTQELLAALQTAKGGEILLLAPGATFEPIFLRQLRFEAPVRIEGGQNGHMPRVLGLEMRECTNIRFRRTCFDYISKPGDKTWTRPFSLTQCSSIRFVNCRFEGDTAKETVPGTDAVEGWFIASGLFADRCDDLRVMQCNVTRFFRGLEIMTCTDTYVSGNQLSGLGCSGMVCAGSKRIKIIGNTFRNFRIYPQIQAHPDMIQFWTAETTSPGEDILIRSNTLDMGEGDWTQSIFMRNERVDTGQAGDEMFYRNIQILKNTIRNNHSHGITVGEAHKVQIEGNTVQPRIARAKLKGHPAPLPYIHIAQACTEVSVIDNDATIQSPFVNERPAAWVLRSTASTHPAYVTTSKAADHDQPRA